MTHPEGKITEKFVSPCAPPTAHEREVAEIILEECSEVIECCTHLLQECVDIQKRVTKLLRFGVNEVQPGQQHTNAYRIGLEVGDLLEIIEVAKASGIIDSTAIAAGRQNKRKQLAKFMQTAPRGVSHHSAVAAAPRTRQFWQQQHDATWGKPKDLGNG